MQRRERTRHLIELGGLVQKAGLVELTDDDRATLYGALLANLVFLPLADKLENRTHEESLSKQMIIQGIKTIQLGDNPRNVEMNLRTFLAPAHRSVAPAFEYRQAA